MFQEGTEDLMVLDRTRPPRWRLFDLARFALNAAKFRVLPPGDPSPSASGRARGRAPDPSFCLPPERGRRERPLAPV